MKPTCIYGLFDPRQPDVIMYVGKGLQKRAEYHWNFFLRKGKAVNSLLRDWFNSLKKDQIEPSWKFIETGIFDWEDYEKFWIAHWKSANPRLCNILDGGNAYPDFAGKIGGPIGGRKGGRTNAESGHCARIAHLGGRKNIELHGCVLTYEDRAKGARTGMAGRVGGRKNAESGHCARIARLGGLASGLKICHQRWHVGRGVVNPNCKLCQEAK